ncbi:MAG TPA: carbamoyltransferase C-terminal domain-containing protein [Planctomycetota bacterium]|nr:carbamoyltransferase C-terminal domain-containing protein [Planctomycetota bacterium]
MLICGIHDGHNAAAALVKDGVLLGALQEERVTRVKNWMGFPAGALERLLIHHGLHLQDVDSFVFSGYYSAATPGKGPGDREAQVRAFKDMCSLRGDVHRRLRKTPLRDVVQRRRSSQRLNPLSALGVKRERIHFIEHHRCHAATAAYGASFDPDALIVTLDGAGDGICASISVYDKEGKLQRLATIAEKQSIGILWALITSLLGMVPLEHEYKIMGMAPYASGKSVRDAADRFASAFVYRDGMWDLASGVPEINYSYEFWRGKLEFVRFDAICAGLQLFTEELISRWIGDWLNKTGRRKLRLSGGVFMNVKLNKLLMERAEVEKIYVFPSCGDETNAIGAAWALLEDQSKSELIQPVGHFYLGTALAERAIEAASELAREKNFRVEKPADIEAHVAELLANGQIVARCDGAEEFGARALGNRSILADPSNPKVVQTINRAIKNRDFWMPFACSVLAEAEERYIANPGKASAPYMILAFDSRNTQEIVAGCHPEDGSIRPQVVTEAHNPKYHRLLRLFMDRTGRGAVLNTSFNLHGEPIVSQPAEAVDVLERSGLKYLALGGYLISKRTPQL